MRDAYVMAGQGRMIPFSQLTNPTMHLMPTEIHRTDRRRSVRIAVVMKQEADPLTVAQAVQDLMRSVPLDPGYSFSLGDEVDLILMPI